MLIGEHVVRKKDVFAALPTGFGKSLNFQILLSPFKVLLDQVFNMPAFPLVIVVSPLSLILKTTLVTWGTLLWSCILWRKWETWYRYYRGKYQSPNFICKSRVISGKNKVQGDVFTAALQAKCCCHCLWWSSYCCSLVRSFCNIYFLFQRFLTAIFVMINTLKNITLFDVSSLVGMYSLLQCWRISSISGILFSFFSERPNFLEGFKLN